MQITSLSPTFISNISYDGIAMSEGRRGGSGAVVAAAPITPRRQLSDDGRTLIIRPAAAIPAKHPHGYVQKKSRVADPAESDIDC